VKAWVVAAGLIEGPEGLLLVCNRRRDGSLDWSPPGGVIEVHEGEDITDGLSREVLEETGLVVSEWEGPVYDVSVEAPSLGWSLEASAFVAASWTGTLHVDDPDQIVVDAKWVPADLWMSHLDSARPWVREPLQGWLTRGPLTAWRYRVDGTDVVPLHDA
jgi:8-oxo-dGTP diphosphatase